MRSSDGRGAYALTDESRLVGGPCGRGVLAGAAVGGGILFGGGVSGSAMSVGGPGGPRVASRSRSRLGRVFTQEQRDYMENYYQTVNHSPSIPERQRMADTFGVPYKSVEIWFEDRRRPSRNCPINDS
jgi:hypothetical protein